ncbi:Flagellar M-ring protein FliF [Methylocella tundrae]|uniref:Flagellar M-ring protein n=1 Tax=Methylocella tundrae TaxID=227605 RepID=A0A4U8YZW9_METTU|nr:flagellar basal-body MS-ring/collar protein FliF [Methylocella tundrae]WPP04732.1 flagellar basal-body MS-ring/collar protein FliF [Methylocella tundrae]VFU06932.1 Flagellar M-ring protein FliF [Methylocella tundrae]VTZ27103.1 Flagellar M-ring protein FliF [Methylocella tundrae]VTZ50040.1 Flagellar M-ring protein FliF [Methylocella tundrae]
MVGQKQIERIWANLLKLGSRRLIALAMIGVSVFAMTGLAGYFLSRPALEVLYAGLDRQDVSRIGAALKEADIAFDVNSDGNTVLVRYGETARARMLLAEKGLPNSPNAGNELFDKLGSLGLTSFMQEVTRVRALEGELARTIQLMRGVKAARVHVVMPDQGSFRRTREPPSASVVIRTEMADDVSAAKSIRHLVASAVPGMTMEEVTVLNTEGVLLASGNDLADSAPGGMLTLERTVSQEILDNIRKTLTPYLGLRNFQISVAARLNTDKRQTSETIFNPDSRVERSVKITKQNQTSQNSVSQSPATVERNLPQETVKPDDGKQSSEESKKSEELTNYEVSSKTISTTSGGYGVDNISVAVLINRASLLASLGGKATPEAIQKQLNDLEQLVASAAGAHKERGDNIKISAVDFIDADRDLAPQPPPAVAEMLLRQSGNVLNAVTILVVTLLLIWFGLRPAARAILAAPAVVAGSAETVALENFSALDGHDETGLQLGGWGPPGEVNLIEDLTNNPRRSPQKRLEQIVEFDEEQAAAILKQWMHQGDYA